MMVTTICFVSDWLPLVCELCMFCVYWFCFCVSATALMIRDQNLPQDILVIRFSLWILKQCLLNRMLKQCLRAECISGHSWTFYKRIKKLTYCLLSLSPVPTSNLEGSPNTTSFQSSNIIPLLYEWFMSHSFLQTVYKHWHHHWSGRTDYFPCCLSLVFLL